MTDSQPVRNVESKFFLELLKNNNSSFQNYKPVLLRANQGRINKQTFSGLPHGEP